MQLKLLFLFNVILAFYSTEGFKLTGVRYKYWDNKYFVEVVPRGGCSFCVCEEDRLSELDKNFIGESKGNDVCPYCHCKANLFHSGIFRIPFTEKKIKRK
uniref:Uncharacterized protein n=1 Tax=Trichobilharzia regenti TaxID=157069 RepID=A0AA85KH87_TRIRE|nr:unnamed protein product [Trichobilharzia regenti]